MKQYAVLQGVPPEDIFMDHAGFSTYESIYRAKEIFRAESILVVTQRYHMYRALYIADKMDLTCSGVLAEENIYIKGRICGMFARCWQGAKTFLKRCFYRNLHIWAKPSPFPEMAM